MSHAYVQINESIVAKTTITLPVNGGALEAVSTIETVPYWTRSRKSGNKNYTFWLKALKQNHLYSFVYRHSCQSMDRYYHYRPVGNSQ